MHDDAQQRQKSDAALREEEVLAFWKEHKIFERSLEKPAPKGEFVFYEGPPTANGKPGLHHLEARAFKDAIPRYKTMQGYRVKRRAGWDTHGLPVELEVEKQLGFSGKPEIEAYGVAAFNQKCRESVLRYIDEWWRFTERIGYWVDQADAYYTYTPTYMERLWGILAKVHRDRRLYKDYKVVPWCPRCGTALSSHEVAQGYEEVSDLAVVAKFRLRTPEQVGEQQPTFILAWTTTPWTLPGNVALAVGGGIQYLKVRNDGETLIVAKDRASSLGLSAEGAESLSGEQLVGQTYEPLYPFARDLAPESERERFASAFKVYEADFVTTEDGTGVVHTAVMYGADDFLLGQKNDLPRVHVVEPSGRFMDGVGFLAGRFVRDEGVAVDIIKDLAHRGHLFSKGKHAHSYPFCWRCKTALIYYARDSWYIRMSELADTLQRENATVAWVPAHLRDGRMGEWLRGIKDWAISRERYWATPLPVWEGEGEHMVIGSVDELKRYSKKSGNTYFLMRHGQAMSNVGSVVSSHAGDENHLTDSGRAQVAKSAQTLKWKRFDAIYASPFIRTRETAEIVADACGFPKSEIRFDDRIQEIDTGEFDGKSVEAYHHFFSSYQERFYKTPPGGENLMDMRRRIGAFLYELEEKHHGETILIVTHEYAVWLAEAIARGADVAGTVAMKDREEYYTTGEVREFQFVRLPHNADYELDLHRPFIDSVVLESPTGKELHRVPDVVDVWFDSGGMPFGTESPYPADYIAEAIDQTRGWFYTLLAVGVLMGKGAPYNHVVSLGHLLDAEGKKMSKSRGNVVNPWDAIEQWGADALRFWMFSVNDAGDPKNFDEKTVREAARALGWFDNSAKFYEIFKNEGGPDMRVMSIDQWMQRRTEQVIVEVTSALDAYNLTAATRALAALFEDISQWYVRRIRDRVRDGDRAALQTLRKTLHVSARLLAPFAPFLAEAVYRGVRDEQDPVSVHLAAWPTVARKIFDWKSLLRLNSSELVLDMQKVRELVSLALEARQKEGIKVRQPLSRLKINAPSLANKNDLLDLIRDELNVKEVVVQEGIPEMVELDTTLTDALREEGEVRELIREVQEARKIAGLNPKDRAVLSVPAERLVFAQQHFESLERAASISEVREGDFNVHKA